MAKPSFAPPAEMPADGPLMEVPADPPFDFIGKPEGVGKPDGVGQPGDHLPPVDLSGLPPVDPPFEDTPVDPPLFDAPPVSLPEMDIG